MKKNKFYKKESKQPIKRRKRTPEKKITIDGQAVNIKQVISKYASGFPLPMQRDELEMPTDINDIFAQDFDLPNPERIAGMDLNEKRTLGENVRQLRDKVNHSLKDYEKKLTAQKKEAEKQKLKAEAKAELKKEAEEEAKAKV